MSHLIFGMERSYRFKDYQPGDIIPDAPGIWTGLQPRATGWRYLYFEIVPSLYEADRVLSQVRRLSLKLGETWAAYLTAPGSWSDLEAIHDDLVAAHIPPCNTATLAAG